MAKRLTYGEYLSPNYRPIMQQDAARFKAIMERNEKIANSPLEDRNGIDVDLDIVPTATSNTGNAGGTITGTSVLGNESAAEAAKSLYVQPNLIKTMGYTEWLEAGGMTGMAQKQYDAAVRAAETDYAKSKALYGQNAETLGRAGLTGSGYGDYLTGAGFAAMQGAKVAAADTRALTEAQQRSDYANYLMTVDAQNREAQAVADAQNRQTYAEYLTREGGAKQAIEDMMLSGNDDAAIRAYIQQHYGNEFDSQLDSWITGAHAYTDPILAKQQEEQAKIDADKAAAETEANKQIALERKQAAIAAYEQYASEQGGEYAKGMMQALGYTEAEIADAAATVQALASAAQNTFVDLKGLAVEQIPTADAIDNEVTLGRMSAEAGAALKKDAAARRAQIFKESLEALADPKTDTATASAEAIKLFDQIDALGAEDLTDEARAELYALRAEAYLNTAVEGNEPVSEVLKAFVDLGLDDDNANEAARKGFLNGMSKAIKVIDVNPGKLESSAVGAAIGTAVSFINPGMAGVGAQIGAAVGSDYTITVTAGEKNNGKDAKENIGVRTTKADDKEATALGDGSDKEIKALNGKLYIYDGKWKRVTRVTNASVGGKDNAKLMYDILLDYYS